MAGRWLRILWLVTCVAATVLLSGVTASAFIVADGEEGRVIQALIQNEILPLFENAPGLVCGIEDLTIFQDPDEAQTRVWIFLVVLTEQTATGPAIVQKELTFRGSPGSMPHLVSQGKATPWPDTPAFPPN
jgi:hypothetical protein